MSNHLYFILNLYFETWIINTLSGLIVITFIIVSKIYHFVNFLAKLQNSGPKLDVYSVSFDGYIVPC